MWWNLFFYQTSSLFCPLFALFSVHFRYSANSNVASLMINFTTLSVVSCQKSKPIRLDGVLNFEVDLIILCWHVHDIRNKSWSIAICITVEYKGSMELFLSLPVRCHCIYVLLFTSPLYSTHPFDDEEFIKQGIDASIWFGNLPSERGTSALIGWLSPHLKARGQEPGLIHFCTCQYPITLFFDPTYSSLGHHRPLERSTHVLRKVRSRAEIATMSTCFHLFE